MAILTTAVGKDITLLRPHYIFTTVFKAFGPYIVVVALLLAACVLEMQTTQYDHSAFAMHSMAYAITTGRLGLNLAVQLIAVIAMRSIGLFYRHYSCHLRW